VRHWGWALASCGGTVLGCAAYFAVDETTGAFVILITLVAAFTGESKTIGAVPGPLRRSHSGAEVRAYRRSHPGSTIGDALSALDRGEEGC
jgi:hypothetical protein